MESSRPMCRAIFVYCLRRDTYQNPRKIFLYGFKDPVTQKTCWLSNGCDHMDGSAICCRCCDSASHLLTSQSDLDTSGPISLGPFNLPKDGTE